MVCMVLSHCKYLNIIHVNVCVGLLLHKITTTLSIYAFATDFCVAIQLSMCVKPTDTLC